MASVRQSDIAERLGITQQAVAYALSDQPDYHKKLNDQTRRRIVETARQLGYVPHRAARSLRRGKTDTILVTTKAALHHAHVHEFIEAFNEALVPHGKEMLLELSSRTESTDRVLRTLAAGSADGLVVLGYEAQWLAELLGGLPADLPKVMVGPGEPAGISSVDYDREQATELAVTHLLDQGHRHVAMVYDISHDKPPEQRLRGYRAALEKAGLSLDETLLFRASAAAPDPTPLWDRIQACQPRPSAILCYNDELTMALLQVMRLAGMRVPQDVALATMGNTRLTSLGDVPLTTVDTNYRGMAQAAAGILLEQMQTPGAAVRHVRVEPHLVVRTSSVRENVSETKTK